MPFYRVGNTVVHIKMAGKPPKPCVARVTIQGADRPCRAIASYACDWPLEGGGTCDAPLCGEHAHQIGRNRHLCPIHRAQRARIQPELFE